MRAHGIKRPTYPVDFRRAMLGATWLHDVYARMPPRKHVPKAVKGCGSAQGSDEFKVSVAIGREPQDQAARSALLLFRT